MATRRSRKEKDFEKLVDDIIKQREARSSTVQAPISERAKRQTLKGGTRPRVSRIDDHAVLGDETEKFGSKNKRPLLSQMKEPPSGVKRTVIRGFKGRMMRKSIRPSHLFRISPSQRRLIFKDLNALDILNKKRGVTNVVESFLKDSQRIFRSTKNLPGLQSRKRLALLRRGKILGTRTGIILGAGGTITYVLKKLPKPFDVQSRSHTEPPGERFGKKFDRALGFTRPPGRPPKLIKTRERRRIVRKVFGLEKTRGLQDSRARSIAAKKAWETRRRLYGRDGRRN